MEIKFVPVTTNLDNALAELGALSLSKPDALQLLFDRVAGLEELLRIEVKCDPAAGTSDLLVLLEPSDTLTNFITALRAADVDDLVVE